MFLSVLIGFCLGLSIPAVSGRFGKVLPADPGHIFLNLWHRPRFPKPVDVPRARDLYGKWKKLILFSLGWGCALGTLFLGAKVLLPAEIVPWAMIFITMIGFCIAVDSNFCLLPDFFTIPILILGFGAGALMPVLTPLDSFVGARFGYLISVVAVMILGFARPSEIGAGDVKMMAGLGAWLGASGLNFSLMLSFFLFAIPATIRTKRQGPYGPALGLAAIIAFFFVYMK